MQIGKQGLDLFDFCYSSTELVVVPFQMDTCFFFVVTKQ